MALKPSCNCASSEFSICKSSLSTKLLSLVRSPIKISRSTSIGLTANMAPEDASSSVMVSWFDTITISSLPASTKADNVWLPFKLDGSRIQSISLGNVCSATVNGALPDNCKRLSLSELSREKSPTIIGLILRSSTSALASWIAWEKSTLKSAVWPLAKNQLRSSFKSSVTK